jgi:multicomponent K+:H+ antiporter subunit E
MKRLLPQPLVSLLLLVVWLLLNNTVHPAHLLLGAALAVGIPLFSSRLTAGTPRLPPFPQLPQWRKGLLAMRLGGVVFYDIIKSNLDVARLILGRESNIRPAFVWLPLDLNDDHAKAVLAGIITMTPGTLSSDFSEDGRWLLIHALNVPDQDALIADIKSRYEAPLKEIFE